MSRMHEWGQVRLWIATSGYLEYVVPPEKKRGTRLSLVNSDDIRDLNSKMSQPILYSWPIGGKGACKS